MSKRYEEALKDFDRAIEINSDSAENIADRGLTYQIMKRYENALKDFDRAIQLDPKEDSYFYLRALTYRAYNEFDKSQKDLDNAIKLIQDKKDVEDSVDFENTLSLIFYNLAAGNNEACSHLEHQLLEAPIEQITQIIVSLKEVMEFGIDIPGGREWYDRLMRIIESKT